jgi:hypothetical protein
MPDPTRRKPNHARNKYRKEHFMSTIHFHQSTTSTPEQFVAGLTDFGPGRSKVFAKSADSYLKVHPWASMTPMSPKARVASGNACCTTGPIPTGSRPRQSTPTCSAARLATNTP